MNTQLFKNMFRDYIREILQEVVAEQLQEVRNSPPQLVGGGCSWVVPYALKVPGFCKMSFGVIQGAVGSLTRFVGWETIRLGGVVGAYVVWQNRENLRNGLSKWWAPPIIVHEMTPTTLPDLGGPEALIQGSEIRTVTSGLPPCMAKISIRVEQEGRVVYRAIGNCTRVGSAVFMPKHLTENGPVYIMSNNDVNLKADKNTRVEYEEDTDMISCPDDDLLMLSLSEAELSVLGLKKPSIATVSVGLSQQATAYTRALSQSSSGLLRGSTTFGVLCYTGSTTKGWSGGVYMTGTRLLGMHFFGNPNKGYAAAYLDILQRRGVPEGGDYDWFLRELEAQDYDVDELWNKGRMREWGLDEILWTDARGKIHMLQLENFNSVIGKFKKSKNKQLVDPYEESGPEGLLPQGPVVFVSEGTAGQVAKNSETGTKSTVLSPQDQFAALSRKQQKSLMSACNRHSVTSLLNLAKEKDTPKP